MARTRTWTVAALAAATDLDIEQVLIALWGEGIEYPLEPTSRIRAEDGARAERATGIAGSRLKRISYWLDALSISRDELVAYLAKTGVRVHPQASTVPKGAIRRLRLHPKLTEPRASSRTPETVRPMAPPLRWVVPGNTRDCSFLTADEIEQVHEALTADFAFSNDPISPPGVKSRPLLESAAGRPASSFGDTVKYPSAESAAAALLHSVVHNHPFHNGNKRTALVATLVFLDRHNLVLQSDEVEIFRFMLRVAAHTLLDPELDYDRQADREVLEIANWIHKRTRTIRREDRAITWRELAPRLRDLDCTMVDQRDEWIQIERRVVIRRGLLMGKRSQTLSFRFRNTGDGREVPKSVLKRMRQMLQLDVEHGFDAEVFYGDAKPPDFFIAEYSQLLRRLARV